MPSKRCPSVRALVNHLRITTVTATKMHRQMWMITRGSIWHSPLPALEGIALVMAEDATYWPKKLDRKTVWDVRYREFGDKVLGYQICFPHVSSGLDRLVFDKIQWRFRLGNIQTTVDKIRDAARREAAANRTG